MTDQERKVMKMALEALEHVDRFDLNRRFCFDEEIDDLRTALAQNPLDIADRAYFAGKKDGIEETLAQPEQEEEQKPVGFVKDLFKLSAMEKLCVYGNTKVYLAEPPSKQEPVGYFDSNVLQVPAIYRGSDGWVTEMYSIPRGNCTSPLYTAPVSKPWVSLKSEELASIVVEHAGFPTRQLAAIEAKLKEKNNG